MAVRTKGQVKMALRVLAASGYIKWDPDKHFELEVLKGWEVKSEEVDAWEKIKKYELFPGL